VVTEHYNVAIATPGYSFHNAYVVSLVQTITELQRLGISYTFLNKYSSFIPHARESTAADKFDNDFSSSVIASGRFTCDKIFWIDSDIEWKPEEFIKLYESDEDIISGLYVLSGDGLAAANRLDENGIMKRTNSRDFMFDEDPVVVGGVGFGFLCVKASVWNSIPRPWFLIGKMQWSPDSEMRVNVGEDYSWCGRAQQAGYQIKLDPTVRVGHHKQIAYFP